MPSHLPRAYLRIDPNLDQHPDAYLLLDLICAGARQLPRGRFRSYEHAVKALGKVKAAKAVNLGHLKVQPDGALVIDGWDIWQEGDLTVGERVRRFREKRFSGVTSAVTGPLPDRKSPSEARDVRRKTEETDLPAHSPARASEPADRHGEPGEAETLQTEALAALEAAHLATGVPRDVLLTRASQVRAGGPLIVNIRNCSSVRWLRTTIQKLTAARLSAQADSEGARASPPPTVKAQQRREATNAFLAAGMRAAEADDAERDLAQGDGAAARLLQGPRPGQGERGHQG